MATKVEVKGNTLIITLDINTAAPVSKSGKSRIIAGTGGFAKTTATVDGKPVSVSVNAIIGL